MKKLIKCYCYGKSLVIQHPSYAFSIIELSILSFERERGEIIDKYIKRQHLANDLTNSIENKYKT